MAYKSRAKRYAEIQNTISAAYTQLENTIEECEELNNITTVYTDAVESQIQAVLDCESDVQELHDELESWYDNLPENFQNGSKGESLQEAMTELDEMISDFSNISIPDISLSREDYLEELKEQLSNIENLNGHEVSFPGMYS